MAYSRNLDILSEVYHQLLTPLEKKKLDLLVETFHGQMDEASRQEIPKSFARPNCPFRCLVTTIAYGMGMQIPDVKFVVHWGPPSSILDYWQEVGRCARDGSPGKAIMFKPKNSIDKRFCTSEVIQLANIGNDTCIRQFVLKQLQLKSMDDSDIDMVCGDEKCCSHCSNKMSE